MTSLWFGTSRGNISSLQPGKWLERSTSNKSGWSFKGFRGSSRTMRCDVLTLFPGIVEPVLEQSILKRAKDKGLLSVTVCNLRDFTTDKHRTADDHPFGGGAGMVLKPEPIFRAVEKLSA